LQLLNSENGFFAELQQEIILFIGIPTSCNIPGGSLKIIYQIRSKGFLAVKILNPPLLFSYQITIPFSEENKKDFWRMPAIYL
jgi:hypothetical protein